MSLLIVSKFVNIADASCDDVCVCSGEGDEVFGPSQRAEVYRRALQRQTAQLHRGVHQRRNTERHHQEHGVCVSH